jgi:hypothetical protein
MHIKLRLLEKRSRPLPGGDNLCLIFAVALLLGLESGLAAQGLISPVGPGSATLGGAGVGPPAQLPLLKGTQNVKAKVHLGPTGKPCLTVRGDAKPQIVNPKIFTHLIMANNDCSQPIKVAVCYYQSQQCVPLDVPAYGRKEVVLGIMPVMNQFQFEYRELFNQGM